MPTQMMARRHLRIRNIYRRRLTLYDAAKAVINEAKQNIDAYLHADKMLWRIKYASPNIFSAMLT